MVYNRLHETIVAHNFPKSTYVAFTKRFFIELKKKILTIPMTEFLIRVLKFIQQPLELRQELNVFFLLKHSVFLSKRRNCDFFLQI